MAAGKGFYEQTGNTLTVWFGSPPDEYVCEETGEEVILMKDVVDKLKLARNSAALFSWMPA
jgi:hypothetical protein